METSKNQMDLPQIGDYFCLPCFNGCYQVAKVLLTSPFGIHLRVYSNIFHTRPTSINNKKLTFIPLQVVKETFGLTNAKIKPINPTLTVLIHWFINGEILTAGHFPVNEIQFWNRNPQFIQSGRLEESDIWSVNFFLEAMGIENSERLTFLKELRKCV